MPERVILVGAFGEIVELCLRAGKQVVGIIDNNLEGEFLGIPILGKDADALALFRKYASPPPVVIAPDAPVLRRKLYDYYAEIGFRFATVISPLATVSPSASIGNGSVIQDYAYISSDVVVGVSVRLNVHAVVMHDCRVDDFVTVAPRSTLLGRIHIKNGAYIGANSTVLPMREVGCGSIVGAGAVVTKNVRDGQVVKGVPAK